MSDVATRFHENWLGLVQPVDGLVVSVPVLVDAECMERQPPAVQQQLAELCPPDEQGRPTLRDVWALLEEILGLSRGDFDEGDALPEELSLYVPEGGQTLRPTAALRRAPDEGEGSEGEQSSLDDSTPASRAGAGYSMLLWVLPPGLPMDKPEAVTGPWEYPPGAKLDRLLRECRVPIGLLCNGHALRLYYAPHGESSGSMTFRVADMLHVGGRPILDALMMLLSDFRWFGAEPERRLPAILRKSRERQADVTNELADQLFEALTIMLQGFADAAERDGDARLREALAQEDDPLYRGLLTLLLRLVFVLYAEDRGLMPTEHPLYGEHLSVLALFESLQDDHGAHPDTMGRRFGAYPRLVALFRAVYFGVRHEDLYIPPRSGVLFDPGRFPFLEGWGPAGGAPVAPGDRAMVRVPSVSDETVYRVLDKLLMLGGQRLSYRALEVEQIGSVYEALMGYHVQRVAGAAVCVRPLKLWVEAGQVLAVKPGGRAKWLVEQGLAKPQAKRIAAALKDAKTEEAVLEGLERFAVKRMRRVSAGELVIQPGEERRRTSSHYTPRSLSEPIVRRTLEPLIAAMDDKGEPPSEKLLRLKVCDPAMGSGAFLVAACRFLADQVVAAWTREGVLAEVVASHEDPVMHARRLVAQRCLYGVDKNPFAVNLAKLSLWLETLAKDEPFTFVDHALKCGDSLVGLSIAQIKRFEWTPDVSAEAKAEASAKGKKKRGRKKKASAGAGQQLGLFDGAIERALLAAYSARRKLLELAEAEGDHAALGAEKARLHEEAEHALERARIIGDVLIGAFFGETKDKARLKEAARRKDVVTTWLMGGSEAAVPTEVRQWVAEIRAEQRPFHWGVEFPEVFWDERADPLEGDRVNRAAWIDAVVGNPPFMGGSGISGAFGRPYLEFILHENAPAHGNADYCAHFFRRGDWLLGLHGTLGLVGTNTISQGDTRATGLQHLLKSGHIIYHATSRYTWTGDANVNVAIVHLAKGAAAACLPDRHLDGRHAQVINSRLRPKPERTDPVHLRKNRSVEFSLGVRIDGNGFILSPEERLQLIQAHESNSDRIFPFLGGQDVNTSPTQEFDRFVINFERMPLEQASNWPILLEHVRNTVKPQREKVRSNTGMGGHGKKYWWQFTARRDSLFNAIRQLDRCLVTARVTKHLCFSFQPTNRILNEKLYVFPFCQYRQFSLLQSNVHSIWAWHLSSTMRTDLNYSATDCFETFPFPHDLSTLESIGERLYTSRAQYMIDTDQGLTKTYNALKDPSVTNDPRIDELRNLHIEMDRAVLAAYGWADIEVPPYTDPVTPAEKEARQAFEDEVLDRLFALNAERAAEEARLGKKGTK